MHLFGAIVSHGILMNSVQGWWDPSMTTPWRRSRPGPNAVKEVTLLSCVPGFNPTLPPPDQAHTWFMGIGQDFTGSAVVAWCNPCLAASSRGSSVLSEVLLACRWKWWAGRNLQQRLVQAFRSFDSFRRKYGLTTTFHEFSLKSFKCVSSLNRLNQRF